MSISWIIEPLFFKKNVVSLAYAEYRNWWLQILTPSIWLLAFKRKNKTSKTRINKFADIESPSHASFWSLKYWVVVPEFIIQDSCSFVIVLIQLLKDSPKPSCLRIDKRNVRSTERLFLYLWWITNLQFWAL